MDHVAGLRHADQAAARQRPVQAPRVAVEKHDLVVRPGHDGDRHRQLGISRGEPPGGRDQEGGVGRGGAQMPGAQDQPRRDVAAEPLGNRRREELA